MIKSELCVPDESLHYSCSEICLTACKIDRNNSKKMNPKTNNDKNKSGEKKHSETNWKEEKKNDTEKQEDADYKTKYTFSMSMFRKMDTVGPIQPIVRRSCTFFFVFCFLSFSHFL